MNQHWLKLAVYMLLLLWLPGSILAQTVEEATGGEAISADDVGGSYTTLTGPVIEETSSGQLSQGGTIIFTAPAGYEWATGGTNPAVSIGPAEGVWLGTNLQISYTGRTSTTVTFTVTQASSPGFFGLSRAGLATFSNLRVRPTTGIMPNTGDITNTGTTGPGGSQSYGTLTMVVGARTQLAYIQQPSDATVDEVITPPISLRLQDQYGNNVPDQGISISMALSSGTGVLSGTTTQSTDASGIVTFNDLSINQTGLKNLTASGTGLTSVVSDQFEILPPGVLTSFLIEQIGGGTIPTQTAGTAFSVQITAVDGSGNTITDFLGTVDISSAGTISSGGGSTANFVNGVLSSHSITMTSAGDFTLVATETGGAVTGVSNQFTVDPAAASPATSQITAAPTVIQNDGASTATITVQLRDIYGNNLTSGGDNVVLNATAGTLGSVTDNNNGAYQATLTSSTTSETATITGTVNSQPITDDAQVLFSMVNTWLSSTTFFGFFATTYNRAANWSLNAVPTSDHAVVIPQNPSGGTGFPITDGSEVRIKSLTVESGADFTITAGDSVVVTNDVSGGGDINAVGSGFRIGGDIIIDELSSSGSALVMDGPAAQEISGVILFDSIQVDNVGGVSATNNITVDGDLEIFSSLTMQSGTLLKLNGSIRGSGGLTANQSTIEFKGPVNIATMNLGTATAKFLGTTEQSTGSFQSVQDLIINNSAGVTLDNDIAVSGTLTLTSGTLTMPSGRNLIANTKSIGSGDLRFEREVAGTSGWRLLSSPVTTSFGDFLGNIYTQGYTGADSVNGSPSVLYYDETYTGTENQRWRKPNADSDLISPGAGYFVYFFGDIAGEPDYSEPLPDTLDVLGQENEGNGTEFDFGVTYTATGDTGWNLIGNPFGATIDWDDTGNWSKTNMDNVVYVWDDTSNDGNGEYLVWNGSIGSLGNGLIAPFQGFWVKANSTSPVLKVQKAAKTTGGVFYKPNTTIPAIEFTLEADSLRARAYIGFSDEGKPGNDPLDAYRLEPLSDTFVALYTTSPADIPFQINQLPRDLVNRYTIPLYVGGVRNSNPINGTYMLQWEGLENIPEQWTIELVDRKSNVIIDLSSTEEYTFTHTSNLERSRVAKAGFHKFYTNDLPVLSKAVNADNRFEIRINPYGNNPDVPSNYILEQNYPNPFNVSTTIRFGLPEPQPVKIQIFDITGRRVTTLRNQEFSAGYHNVIWNASENASGVYFCLITTPNRRMTQKMVLLK